MGSYITIPEGKRVRFKMDGKEVPGTEGVLILLEEDVTISMGSDFSSVSDSSSPKALSILSGVLRDAGMGNIAGWAGGQFKQLGFQTWTGTKSLETSFTVNLFMKTDAKKDVLEPTLALARLCLPTEGAGGSLIPPGPSIKSALEGSDSADPSVESGKILHCYIGKYALRNVILKRAQPTFSKYIDENGYPISSKVELSVVTIFSATAQMLDDMLEDY